MTKSCDREASTRVSTSSCGMATRGAVPIYRLRGHSRRAGVLFFSLATKAMMIGFYPRLRALFCKQNYDTGLFKQLESILGTVVGFVNLM